MTKIQQGNSDYELESLVPVTIRNGSTNDDVDNTHLSKVLLDSGKDRSLWTPFYLRRTTLISFVVAKLGIFFAVISLALIDTKHNGIATTNSSQHYLWTYGPTAVLSVLAALWGQVEHRTKQGMPWKALQQGSSPASETLLLDYVTPSLPEALVKSIRLAHWPVTVAITNSLLIKLITVASTGLLVLQKTPIVYQDCHLTASNDFVANFNASAVNGLLLSVSAIRNGSIPYPPGTSHDTAFQKIEAVEVLSGIANVEVEGHSRVFKPELDCETGTVTSIDGKCEYSSDTNCGLPNNDGGCEHPHHGGSGKDPDRDDSDNHPDNDGSCPWVKIVVRIKSPTCQVDRFSFEGSRLHGPGDQPEYEHKTDFTVDCNHTSDGHDSTRLLFIVGRINATAIAHEQDPAIDFLDNDRTVILCEPKYRITSKLVRMDLRGNLKDVSQIHPSKDISQPLSAWDLVYGLRASAADASVLLTGSSPSTSAHTTGWLWTLLRYWITKLNRSTNLSDAKDLKSSANELFSMATSQMVKANFMVPSATDLVGTCYGTEERLRVRGLALYFVGVTLIISALSGLLLVYIAPRGLTSRDPASIGGSALILSSSPAILSRLLNDGSSDLQAVQNRLQEAYCQSFLSTDGQRYRFCVQLTSKRRDSNTTDISEASISSPPPIKFWRPLSLCSSFKLSVLVFLLCIVAALEFLYSLSQKQNGLAQVNPNGYVRFSWVYGPATIMLAAQALVGMIAFSSLFVFPYFLLRVGICNMRKDILQDYISQTAVESAWKSATNKRLPVFCAALVLLLSPMLTIAVSGLYTAQAVEIQKDVTLSVLNQLDISQLTSGQPDENEEAQTYANVGLLQTQNVTYPLSTYDELAFPGIRLNPPSPLDTTETLAGNIIRARLPAIRAGLSCDSSKTMSESFWTLSRNDARMPDAYREFDCYDLFISYIRKPEAFGFFSMAKRQSTNATVYCGAYGTSKINWRFFWCYGTVDYLDVDVTMDAATLVVQKADPDERTLGTFDNSTVSFPYSFPGYLIPFVFNSADRKQLGKSSYDSSFQAVIYNSGTTDNPDNFPIGEFLDDEGFRRIELFLRHVVRTVIAQYANVMMRVPYDNNATSAPPATVKGTLTNPNVYRLQQSVISTRILDGLLIAIALCIAVSFTLMDTRRVLPKNPASIAAAASLIAGDSDMLKPGNLPEEAQWYSDAELEKRGVWGGCVFRLGWWEDSTGQATRFGLNMGRVES